MFMAVLMLIAVSVRAVVMAEPAAGVLCARRAAFCAGLVHATSMAEDSHCSTSTTTRRTQLREPCNSGTARQRAQAQALAKVQVVARYKLVVGRRINLATLVADARHSWLDALSSFGALVGLVAVALGFRLATRSPGSR
jgi:hypothetical protein